MVTPVQFVIFSRSTHHSSLLLALLAQNSFFRSHVSIEYKNMFQTNDHDNANHDSYDLTV